MLEIISLAIREKEMPEHVVISPKKHLISCIEFKSQVGSFGNNFNNRTEEALGNAVDIWTAFREGSFPGQQAPWLGYLIIVEKSQKSSSPVSVREPHFKVFDDFRGTSYLDRYGILCEKLVRERHYTAATAIWTSRNGKKTELGFLKEDLSFWLFLESFVSYLKGKLSELK